MEPQGTVKSPALYDTDYQQWLDQTVAQLKAQDFSNLDLENLIEEIESLGRSDKRAISSYLPRLCEHLLKLKYWESERELCFSGWLLEINNFRSEIELILQDSPSLKPFIRERFLSVYQKARKSMVKAIALPPNSIPQEPDFTLEQALDEDWLPWQPKQTRDSGALHGNIAIILSSALFAVVNAQKLGALFDSSTAFKMSNGNKRSPDISFFAKERL